MLCIGGFDGYFKRLNPTWERVLGFTADELLAEPFLSFVHPEDVERTRSAAQLVAMGTQTATFENRYRCKDGAYKWLSWTARAYPDRQLIYATARDITVRKTVEEALSESEQQYGL